MKYDHTAYSKIAVHHVGARNGGSSLLSLAPYSDEYVAVLFEADVDTMDDLHALSGAGDIILPYCMGAVDGPGVLHMNYCPYTSSLYPTTDRTEDLTSYMEGYDYRLNQAARTMECRDVQQRRFDTLAEIRDGRVPPPTILSLDTQGSEADIIRGGAETIREHTLAIVSEVEFTEFYKGQPLFGDLAAILDDLGFLFVGLTAQQQWYTSRQPLGFRGPGFLAAGDALFIRRLSTVEHEPSLLLKLGLIALSAGHIDYAFDAWSRMPRAIFEGPYARAAYAGFVRDLLSAYDSTDRLVPRQFQDFYSWDISRIRLAPGAKPTVETHVADARRRMGLSVIASEQNALLTHCSSLDTPVEAALRRHGFAGLAEQTKARRLHDVQHYLWGLGLQVSATPAAGSPAPV